EELWRGIEAARAARRRRVIVLRPVLRWSVGIAALLAVGVAIGRWSATGSPTTSPVAAGAERAPTLVYQLAAAQYLTRTEALPPPRYRCRTRARSVVMQALHLVVSVVLGIQHPVVIPPLPPVPAIPAIAPIVARAQAAVWNVGRLDALDALGALDVLDAIDI